MLFAFPGPGGGLIARMSLKSLLTRWRIGGFLLCKYAIPRATDATTALVNLGPRGRKNPELFFESTAAGRGASGVNQQGVAPEVGISCRD